MIGWDDTFHGILGMDLTRLEIGHTLISGTG